MRIIAGARKGRMLVAPSGTTTRPTADRVRQAMFDIIRHAPDLPFCLGVQWHPEFGIDPGDRSILSAFVQAAGETV